ncbi:homoprotocatechuate degradation operon regulator HpaR [Rugamonas sp. DEMB1]|uniref:homoprotocatechuate degradation operon regulator HpaR n=1 Tax=Rugamonas sp. DEMB1 TaxID=3039386 RepID=UPI0024499917|nr:homoprotocatechuate degradation operon regulator HpaR [Rugamonas sp. DEMB1]WGG50893.1 homoprotocatechuate degradation operon regulator HpaR [Rugamonas sp. DEMB1]
MPHQIHYPNLPQRLLKARDTLMAQFRPILHQFGVTEQQYRILRVLDEHAELEPREIVELCQMLAPSLSGVLARMEEVGMVARQRVELDQRRVMVRLAPAGAALLARMGPLIDQQYARMEQAWGGDAFARLLAALDEFNRAAGLPLAAAAPPPAPAPAAPPV